MDANFLARLTCAYAEHPLSAATILARIRRQKGLLEGLTALDLAIDDETGVTDQNHFGGVGAVIEIAEAAGLREGAWVLDVGTGLGGAPRVLAHLFGCRCHGVELTETRCREAVELTRLVGLEERVTFTCGDFLAVEVPDGPFDLVIGQGAFMHFADADALLRKCAALLRPEGWLAVEEGYLRRESSGDREAAKLEALLGCWNGWFHRRDAWRRWLNRAGLAEQRFQDLSELAAQEFRAHLRLAEGDRLASVSESELLGWRLGAELTDSGLIGMMRLLARRVPTSAPVVEHFA
ncbi:MAG: SAM-dependent methyltransferase [Longimicrobiaceae bacterium]